MPKIVVLSNPTQYEKFIAHGLCPADYEIFCDNEAFYDFLTERSVNFKRLDEFLIRERWTDINAWACEKAAAWTDSRRRPQTSSSYDFLSVIYLFFSLILTMMLKNYFYAVYLIERAPFEIVFFESQTVYAYPDFSGNRFLNQFLSELSQKRKISCVTLTADYKDETATLGASHGKEPFSLRGFFRKWIEHAHACLVRPGKQDRFMIYGSLRHLAEVTASLKKSGEKVFIYDFEFHPEQWKFARVNRIPYYTPHSFPDRSYVDSEKFTGDFIKTMSEEVAHASAKGYFEYGSHDFGGWIQKEIVAAMKPYAVELSRQANHYQNVAEICSIEAVLLDEDIGARAFLAAFMRSRGVPVFSTSHANIALDYSVPEASRAFSPSIMFVNSQHEKKGYTDRGWDGKSIRVTGLPRYDRIGLKNSSMPGAANRTLKILFCAGGFWPVTPEMWEYLGCKIFALKKIQTLTAQAVTEAIRELPAELWIKPHYQEDQSGWQKVIERLPHPDKVKLLMHSDDFFECLQASDLMVVSYWSTALLEAGLSGVPVIYADLEGEKSSRIAEFSRDGFCRVTANSSELKMALESFCSVFGPLRGSEMSLERKEYYLGKRDGKNTERVVLSIRQTLHGK